MGYGRGGAGSKEVLTCPLYKRRDANTKDKAKHEFLWI